MCLHFFLLSHTKKSSRFLVLVSKNAADVRKTISKIFLLIAFSKNDKMREEVAQKKIELKHFFIFFSKYVIFKFLHVFVKCCPKGEDLMDKKS